MIFGDDLAYSSIQTVTLEEWKKLREESDHVQIVTPEGEVPQ